MNNVVEIFVQNKVVLNIVRGNVTISQKDRKRAKEVFAKMRESVGLKVSEDY